MTDFLQNLVAQYPSFTPAAPAPDTLALPDVLAKTPTEFLAYAQKLDWPVFAFDIDLLAQQLQTTPDIVRDRIAIRRQTIMDALGTALMAGLHA